MPLLQAYTADAIYTGKEILHHHTVIVQEDRILAVLPTITIRLADYLHTDYGDAILCPALIDLQIYGAHGKLLSAFPEPGTIAEIVAYSRAGGAALCMPTIATQPIKEMRRCIDAVKQYLDSGGTGVAGLHLEGPWIHAGKRGAHVAGWIHAPEDDELVSLMEYGKEVVRMITLAPEQINVQQMALISHYNVIISAGHSNAGYDACMEAFELGVHAVTHLYNAMSGLHHREAGLVGAAFMHPQVKASIIPDGIHVSWPAVLLAEKIMGERLYAITDAVTVTETGAYAHADAGTHYINGGILSGSKLTMLKALQNLTAAGLPLQTAINMCSLHPARVINRGDELGRIKKGYQAQMLVLNRDLEIMAMIGEA